MSCPYTNACFNFTTITVLNYKHARLNDGENPMNLVLECLNKNKCLVFEHLFTLVIVTRGVTIR